MSSKELREYPISFRAVFNKARTHHVGHLDFLESALGISRQIDTGEKDTDKLLEQLSRAIDTYIAAGMDGEVSGSQLYTMILSGKYSPALCEVIVRDLGFPSLESFREQMKIDMPGFEQTQ